MEKLTCSMAGGSFGVVYKGVEKATGEVVAIKHVSMKSNLQPNRKKPDELPLD